MPVPTGTKMPRIRCMQCNKLVDTIEWVSDDPLRRCLSIYAYCHGDRDKMSLDLTRIDSEMMRELESTGEGQAFVTTPKLKG